MPPRELRVVYGQPSTVTLVRDPVSIGRERAARMPTLVVRDAEVSRRHATLTYDATEDAWCLLDAGSKNGTRVDGVRVRHCRLMPGTVLRAGKAVILYLEGDTTLLDERVAGVAAGTAPLLIVGEMGTQKSRLAERVHIAGGRAGGFVTLPPSPTRLEVEDAFASAFGGTLFIGRLGELAPALQPAIAQAIAAGRVRVVATARHPLGEDSLDAGLHPLLRARFAERMLHIPPLRERRQDILPMVNGLLHRLTGGFLSADAAEAVLLYRWPRNEREIEQCVITAVARRRDSGLIMRRDLGSLGSLPIERTDAESQPAA